MIDHSGSRKAHRVGSIAAGATVSLGFSIRVAFIDIRDELRPPKEARLTVATW